MFKYKKNPSFIRAGRLVVLLGLLLVCCIAADNLNSEINQSQVAQNPSAINEKSQNIQKNLIEKSYSKDQQLNQIQVQNTDHQSQKPDAQSLQTEKIKTDKKPLSNYATLNNLQPLTENKNPIQMVSEVVQQNLQNQEAQKVQQGSVQNIDKIVEDKIKELQQEFKKKIEQLERKKKQAKKDSLSQTEVKASNQPEQTVTNIEQIPKTIQQDKPQSHQQNTQHAPQQQIKLKENLYDNVDKESSIVQSPKTITDSKENQSPILQIKQQQELTQIKGQNGNNNKDKQPTAGQTTTKQDQDQSENQDREQQDAVQSDLESDLNKLQQKDQAKTIQSSSIQQSLSVNIDTQADLNIAIPESQIQPDTPLQPQNTIDEHHEKQTTQKDQKPPTIIIGQRDDPSNNNQQSTPKQSLSTEAQQSNLSNEQSNTPPVESSNLRQKSIDNANIGEASTEIKIENQPENKQNNDIKPQDQPSKDQNQPKRDQSDIQTIKKQPQNTPNELTNQQLLEQNKIPSIDTQTQYQPQQPTTQKDQSISQNPQIEQKQPTQNSITQQTTIQPQEKHPPVEQSNPQIQFINKHTSDQNDKDVQYDSPAILQPFHGRKPNDQSLVNMRIEQRLGKIQAQVSEMIKTTQQLQKRSTQHSQLLQKNGEQNNKQITPTQIPSQQQLQLSNLEQHLEQIEQKVTQVELKLQEKSQISPIKDNTNSNKDQLQSSQRQQQFNKILTKQSQLLNKITTEIGQLQTAHSVVVNDMSQSATKEQFDSLKKEMTKVSQILSNLNRQKSQQQETPTKDSQQSISIQKLNEIESKAQQTQKENIQNANAKDLTNQNLNNEKALRNYQSQKRQQQHEQEKGVSITPNNEKKLQNVNQQISQQKKQIEQQKSQIEQQKQNQNQNQNLPLVQKQGQNNLQRQTRSQKIDKQTNTQIINQPLNSKPKNQNQPTQQNQIPNQQTNQGKFDQQQQPEQLDINSIDQEQEEDTIDGNLKKQNKKPKEINKNTQPLIFGLNLTQLSIYLCALTTIYLLIKKVVNNKSQTIKNSPQNITNYDQQSKHSLTNKNSNINRLKKRYDPKDDIINDNQDQIVSERRMTKDNDMQDELSRESFNNENTAQTFSTQYNRSRERIVMGQERNSSSINNSSLYIQHQQPSLLLNNTIPTSLTETLNNAPTIVASIEPSNLPLIEVVLVNNPQPAQTTTTKSIKPIKKPSNKSTLQKFQSTPIPLDFIYNNQQTINPTNSQGLFTVSNNNAIADSDNNEINYNNKEIVNVANPVQLKAGSGQIGMHSDEQEFQQYEDGSSPVVPTLSSTLQGTPVTKSATHSTLLSPNNQPILQHYITPAIVNHPIQQEPSSSNDENIKKQEEQFEQFQQSSSPDIPSQSVENTSIQKKAEEEEFVEVQVQNNTTLPKIDTPFDNKAQPHEQQPTIQPIITQQANQNNQIKIISTPNNDEDDPFSHLM